MPSLKVWDGAAWVAVSGPPGAAGANGYGAGALQTKTSNYTALTTDGLILVDCTSGAVTITLPAVAVGRSLIVKKIDSTINAVTIAPASGLIDGAANVALANQWQARTLVSNGTDWFNI